MGMVVYEKVAEMIETNYQRGIISQEQHDEMMDGLVDQIFDEFGKE